MSYQLIKQSPGGYLSTHNFESHKELVQHLKAMFIMTPEYTIVSIFILPQ